MKKFTVVTFGVVVAAYSQFNIAGSITDTYSTGDTLSATMLDNIKAAVNDNDTSKQDRVTGACGTGQFMFAVNPDGSVACDSDSGGDITGITAGAGLEGGGTSGNVTIGLPNAIISYAGSEFRVTGDRFGCTSIIQTIGFSWLAGTDCFAVIGIRFPHGATITNLACTVRDNSNTSSIAVNLMRIGTFVGAQRSIVTGTQVSSDSPFFQTLFNSTIPTNQIVNNIDFAYYLEARMFGSIPGDHLIVGCKVEYSP